MLNWVELKLFHWHLKLFQPLKCKSRSNLVILIIFPLWFPSILYWWIFVIKVPECICRHIFTSISGTSGGPRALFWWRFHNLDKDIWEREWTLLERWASLNCSSVSLLRGKTINYCYGTDFPDYKPSSAFLRVLFTVKLIKLELQGSSVSMASSKAQHLILFFVIFSVLKKKNPWLFKIQVL